MKKHVVGMLIVIIGLLVLFAPFGYAHACFPKADGGFMKCHWTGEGVKALGVLIVIIAAVMLFNAFVLKKEGLGLGLVIANIAIGAFTMLTPLHIIGTCPNPMMHCNVATKPAILLVSGIFIVTNIIYIFLNKKN